jgi:hypothetical protein
MNRNFVRPGCVQQTIKAAGRRRRDHDSLEASHCAPAQPYRGRQRALLSVAMQVAAHEARQGHGKLAEQLRQLVDETRDRDVQRCRRPVSLLQPKGELAAVVSATYSATRLSSMVLPEDLGDRLKRVVAEQRQQHKILERRLTPRRKLLLLGPHGRARPWLLPH